MALKFDKLSGIFLIEEQFNREIEDEEDDDTEGLPISLKNDHFDDAKSVGGATPTAADDKSHKSQHEKLKCKMSERVRVIENCVKMNRILKRQPIGSNARQCIVERIKFVGPHDPMYIPPIPEDGSEPEPVDEERKTREQRYYDVFATVQKTKIEEFATHLSEFKYEKDRALKAIKQLWPVPIDPEKEAERLRR
jgi:hypothetical protein